MASTSQTMMQPYSLLRVTFSLVKNFCSFNHTFIKTIPTDIEERKSKYLSGRIKPWLLGFFFFLLSHFIQLKSYFVVTMKINSDPRSLSSFFLKFHSITLLFILKDFTVFMVFFPIKVHWTLTYFGPSGSKIAKQIK